MIKYGSLARNRFEHRSFNRRLDHHAGAIKKKKKKKIRRIRCWNYTDDARFLEATTKRVTTARSCERASTDRVPGTNPRADAMPRINDKQARNSRGIRPNYTRADVAAYTLISVANTSRCTGETFQVRLSEQRSSSPGNLFVGRRDVPKDLDETGLLVALEIPQSGPKVAFQLVFFFLIKHQDTRKS